MANAMNTINEERYWEEEREYYSELDLVREIPEELFKGENIDDE